MLGLLVQFRSASLGYGGIRPLRPFSGRVERVTCLGGSFETAITGRGWRLWVLTREELNAGSSIRFAVKKAVILRA